MIFINLYKILLIIIWVGIINDESNISVIAVITEFPYIFTLKLYKLLLCNIFFPNLIHITDKNIKKNINIILGKNSDIIL